MQFRCEGNNQNVQSRCFLKYKYYNRRDGKGLPQAGYYYNFAFEYLV